MEVKVVDVDRMESGIIVSFMDGTVVRYSAALLRQMMPQAEVLHPEEVDEPQD